MVSLSLSLLFGSLDIAREDMFGKSTASSALALAASVSVAISAETNSTPEALNPQLTNTVHEPAGAPVLYYNGSGPVPAYNLTSPIPTPITPFNR